MKKYAFALLMLLVFLTSCAKQVTIGQSQAAGEQAVVSPAFSSSSIVYHETVESEMASFDLAVYRSFKLIPGDYALLASGEILMDKERCWAPPTAHKFGEPVAFDGVFLYVPLYADYTGGIVNWMRIPLDEGQDDLIPDAEGVVFVRAEGVFLITASGERFNTQAMQWWL